MNAEEILALMVPGTYFAMLAAEKLWPARELPKIRGWHAIGVACLLALASLSVVLPLLLPGEWLVAHRLVDGAKLGIPLGVVVGYAGWTFAAMAWHRACHASPFMWRWFHQMHHAPQRLDISGSLFLHPFEVIVLSLLQVAVLVYVLGLDPLSAAIVGYVSTFESLFQHMNVRTPRIIGWVLQRPEAHCHHHEMGVHASNYSDLVLWDVLLGTYKNPERFEGKTGFEGEMQYGKMLLGVDVSESPKVEEPRHSMPEAA